MDGESNGDEATSGSQKSTPHRRDRPTQQWSSDMLTGSSSSMPDDSSFTTSQSAPESTNATPTFVSGRGKKVQAKSSSQEGLEADGNPPESAESKKARAELEKGPDEAKDDVVHPTNKRKRKAKKEDTGGDLELRFGARHLTLLFIPVCVTMIMCLLIMQTIQEERNLVSSYNTQFMDITPFGEGGSSFGVHTTGSEALDALVNALIFISLIIVLTVVVVILFVARCYKVLGGIMGGMMSLGIYMMVGNLMIARVFRALNSTLWNAPIMVLWSINFGVTGPMAIFWKAPPRLTQASICAGTSIVATMLTLMLRKWACWIILGLLALWDIFAVCAPCGPLRILVNKAQQRQHEGASFGKGMLYETFLYLGVHQEEEKEKEKKDEKKDEKGDEKKEEKEDEKVTEESSELSETASAKLGLGDFVFYSILLAKCSNLEREVTDDWSLAVDWACTTAALVSILFGLGVTLMYLSIKQKPLPALPVSILVGLVVTFGFFYLARPFFKLTTASQAFF